ncbi:MAG: O-antigen ligase family protein [Acidimicrobiia bacterium]|nr:O-antigen ligase family protein [Acidimicrobiia bacterium]MBT8191903.1 O-antigen ligase family protein [Acidimicrobiia bacterium]
MERLRSRLVRSQESELRPRTRSARLLFIVFLALAGSWLLGLAEFAWIIVVIPLALHLGRKDNVYAPRVFRLWLIFLGWAFFSVFAAGGGYYMLTVYVAATILFLYVFNAQVDELPDSVLVRVLALTWGILVVGGLLGIVLGPTEFPSLGATIVNPEADTWLDYVTRVQFGDPQEGLLGIWDSRPKGFTPFTNHWGSAFVILLPAVGIVRLQLERGRFSRLMDVMIAASVVPFIVSRNRWAWLSLILVLLYLIARTWRPHPYVGRALLGVLAGFVLIVVVTPLATIVLDRLESEGSEQLRSEMYSQSFEKIEESPWLGFGQVQYSEDPDTEGLQLGGDSQILQTMILHGVPALVLMVVWLGMILVASRRMDTPLNAVTHVAVVVALIQIPAYDLTPHRLMYLMLLAAGAYRYHSTVISRAQPVDLLWGRSTAAEKRLRASRRAPRL